MVYSIAEYVGMAALLVAFIGAAIALTRLDRAISPDPERPADDAHEHASASAIDDAGPVPSDGERSAGPVRAASDPHVGGTRNARRKQRR